MNQRAAGLEIAYVFIIAQGGCPPLLLQKVLHLPQHLHMASVDQRAMMIFLAAVAMACAVLAEPSAADVLAGSKAESESLEVPFGDDDSCKNDADGTCSLSLRQLRIDTHRDPTNTQWALPGVSKPCIEVASCVKAGFTSGFCCPNAYSQQLSCCSGV